MHPPTTCDAPAPAPRLQDGVQLQAEDTPDNVLEGTIKLHLMEIPLDGAPPTQREPELLGTHEGYIVEGSGGLEVDFGAVPAEERSPMFPDFDGLGVDVAGQYKLEAELVRAEGGEHAAGGGGAGSDGGGEGSRTASSSSGLASGVLSSGGSSASAAADSVGSSRLGSRWGVGVGRGEGMESRVLSGSSDAGSDGRTRSSGLASMRISGSFGKKQKKKRVAAMSEEFAVRVGAPHSVAFTHSPSLFTLGVPVKPRYVCTAEPLRSHCEAGAVPLTPSTSHADDGAVSPLVSLCLLHRL
jgi:hypothetical protein